VFVISVGSIVLATIDVCRQCIAGRRGQIEFGASHHIAESSCSFGFTQNRTDGVECLWFDQLVLEDVYVIGELLRKGRTDAHNQVSLCDFTWSPFQLLTHICK